MRHEISCRCRIVLLTLRNYKNKHQKPLRKMIAHCYSIFVPAQGIVVVMKPLNAPCLAA